MEAVVVRVVVVFLVLAPKVVGQLVRGCCVRAEPGVGCLVYDGECHVLAWAIVVWIEGLPGFCMDELQALDVQSVLDRVRRVDTGCT